MTRPYSVEEAQAADRCTAETGKCWYVVRTPEGENVVTNMPERLKDVVMYTGRHKAGKRMLDREVEAIGQKEE